MTSRRPGPERTSPPTTRRSTRSRSAARSRSRNRSRCRDYDSEWPRLYEREEARIRSILGDRVRRIEHVGSTSVPGLPAKPIVDIVLEVPDSSDEQSYAADLEAGGYPLTIREPDWFEHRVFKGPDTNVNLHVFTEGCDEVDRMTGFRDHLRGNEDDRKLYADTKRELAARDWKYGQQYADAEDAGRARDPRARIVTLPQLSGSVFIADGGLETTLIFRDGFRPAALRRVHTARRRARAVPVCARTTSRTCRSRGSTASASCFDTPTWRANPDWGTLLGYSPEQLDDLNRRAVGLLDELRGADANVLISGCIGPRGDGYVAGELMSADEAERYHSRQIGTFRGSGADLVSAITMTYAEEAVGIARAAAAAGVPVVLSFTVETDGRLPSGQPLREAVEQADAETGGASRTSWSTARIRRTSTTFSRATSRG
jgi:GrpB-like predicted nucleotidyltransferase (UPF0157 family)/S-methylmethionine-dependent homocysteine/selenocysteine methylase